MIRIGPAIAIIIVALHAFGCNTVGKQLNALNESTEKIAQAVVPDWDKRCLELATSCAKHCKEHNAATSQPTEKVTGEDCKANCKDYQSCNKDRNVFYVSVNSIHTSIAYAIAFLQTGEEPKAQAILMKMVAALADVYRLAQDAGFTVK